MKLIGADGLNLRKVLCVVVPLLLASLAVPAFAGLIGNGDFVIMNAGRFPDVAYGSVSHKYLVATMWNGVTAQLVNSDGSLYGNPFVVQDPALTWAMYPAVGYNATDNQFLVTFDTSDADGSIHGQLVDANIGGRVGNSFPVGTAAAGQRSAIAWSPVNNSYYVVYTNFGTSFGQRISNTGAKLGTEVTLSGDSWYPAVCYGASGNQYLAVWDGTYGVCARRVDAATGNFLGPILNVADGDRPCVAYDTINNRWLVQYCQSFKDSYGRDQYGRFINPDGTFAGGTFPIFHTYAYETESNFGGDICFIPGKGGRFYCSVPSVTDMFNNMAGQELTTSGAPLGGQINLAVNHGGGNNNAADTVLNRYLAVYEDPGVSNCTRGRLYAAGDPPGAVTGLTAVPGDKQNTLSWQNPSDNDYAGTVIRYKTTYYPATAGDGIQLCTRSPAPGGTDSFVHAGLANYATYYYSVWAYDTNGDYALVAQVSGTPIGLPDAPVVTTPVNGTVVDLSNVDPIGTTSIAWSGNPQTAYQVRLSQEDDPNTATNGWDSGQPTSTSTSIISPVLSDGCTYYIFVRVRNPNGWSPWSASGYKFTARTPGSESSVYNADAVPSASGWVVYDTGSYENGGGITSQIITDGTSKVWSLGDASTSDRCKVKRSVSNISFDTGATLVARVAVSAVSGTQGYNLGISNGNVGGMFLRLAPDQVALVDLNGSVKASQAFDATVYHTYYLTVKNATVGNNNTATWKVYVDGFLVITWAGVGIDNGFDGFMAGDSSTTGTGTWKFDWIGSRCDGVFTPATWMPVYSNDRYAPSAVTNFASVAGTGQVALSWTNPVEPWFTGTLIRYKTTGYPTGPTDGTLVVDKVGTSGANDSQMHSGLGGTTYYYAAFAHDGLSHYATAATTSATPGCIATWMIERFDGYADSNLGGQGAWTKTGAADAQVQSSMSKSGKAVLVDTIASGGAAIADTITFDAKMGGSHYVALDVAQDAAGTLGQQIGYVSFQSADGSEISRLQVQKSRLMLAYGSGSNVILTMSAANNTWYNLRVCFNVDTRTLDVIFNDTVIVTGYAWMGTTGTNLAKIVIASDRNGSLTTQKMYVDNLIGEAKPTVVSSVTDDGAWTPSLSRLHFSFSPAACAGEYRYAIGTTSGGTQTRGWTSCGQSTDVVATGLSLAQNQNYYVSVEVGTGNGTWGSSVTSNGIKTATGVTIQGAKALADGAPTDVKALRGKLVSVTCPGGFYVQEPDAPYGIKVISSAGVSIGDQVDVCGLMKGSGAERYLDCTGNPAALTTPGPGGPNAMAMSAASVGGIALNGNTPGVVGGKGPNNIGSVVTVFGKITAVGTGFFYIDDGSGVADTRINPATGQPYAGVKIISSASPSPDEYWTATGAVTMEADGANLVRALRAVSADELHP